MATEDYKVRIVVESLVGDANSKLRNVSNTTDKFNSNSKKLVGNLKLATIGFIGVTAAAVAFSKVMISATKESLSFNEELANVATLIPGQESRINSLKETIRELSSESGKSLNDLTSGLYQVISAFGDATDTEEKLSIVTKGAIAGQASTTASLNLLSAVTKAYGDTSASALAKVSDLSFMTVKLGQTTFPELAGSIQRVTAVAENMSVSQEELFASFSTLTGVTGTAAEVSTQLRGVLTALSSPSQELAKLYDKLGVSSGKAFVQQEGFQGGLEKVITFAEETGTSLQSLLGRQQAIIGATALGSAQSEVYAEKFDKIKVSAGATNIALAEVTDGINKEGFALKQLKSEWSVIQTQIGDRVLPLFGDLVSSTSGLLGALSGNISVNDKLNTTFKDLAISSADYKAVVTELEDETTDLTDVERTLLNIRKEQLALDLSLQLMGLSDGYVDVEKKISKYNKTIETQTKKQKEAQELIDDWDSKGLSSSMDDVTNAGLRQKNTYYDLYEVESKYGKAQNDFVSSTEKITEAQLGLQKVELERKETIARVAGAVLDGTLNIDSYAISNTELYDDIMDVVDALKEQREAQALLNDSKFDFTDRIAQAMKQYSEYSAEEIENQIEILETAKERKKSAGSIAYIEGLIIALKRKGIIVGNEEVDIATKYSEKVSEIYTQQLFQLTVGEGLVKIENERVRAVAEAKKNYSDTEGVLRDINALYDEQETQFVDNLKTQLSYALAVQNAESDIVRIEIDRSKALAKLTEQGITEQSIIDNTNKLYDDRITKTLELANASWQQKLISINGATEEEKIEYERTKALQDSIDKYGEQADLLDKINKFYDTKLSNYKKEESLLKKIDRAGADIIGKDAYKNLEKVQTGVKKIQDLWSAMQPIVNSVSDAYNSHMDLREQLTEQTIEGLEETAEAERESADNRLDEAEDVNSEKLDALRDMYDNDVISYDEYLAQKAGINDNYEELRKDIERKAIEAENAVKTAQYQAEVAEFERNKKSAIVNAIMAGAQGIMQSWALGPILGIIGTGIISAATAYQVSQISSQPAPSPPTLVPLATGGIATGPTQSLIGEGGEPEMVLPLSKAESMGFGNNSSSNVVNITGNTFVGIEGIDELIINLEERKNILQKRGRI